MNIQPIEIIFDKLQYGYWDGGAKSGGEFTPAQSRHPGPGKYLRWGCWRLNIWFTCKAGRSWREARAIAKRILTNKVGVPATIK